jgi:hypothetical protein
MTADSALIQGGFILLSRQLLRSGIMQQPALYLKLWVWMLLQASFKDHGDLKRGQFFTSYDRMCKAMLHKVGFRTERPTIKQIRGVTKFLMKARMIVTMKVTHGMVITILNYDHYQSIENYEGHNEGHPQGHMQGTIPRKKGIKKEIPPEKNSFFRERYSDQELINRAFDAIASTRKSNKVADTILLAQLKKWERYPVEQVENAIRVYLEKDYAGQGKREEYLLGIIRNNGGTEKASKGQYSLDEDFDPI